MLNNKFLPRVRTLLRFTTCPQVVVGVYVLDINDNDPVILNLPYNLSVREGAAIHTSVARVRARDADSDRNSLLTYNITAGNLGGAFYINDTVRETKGQADNLLEAPLSTSRFQLSLISSQELRCVCLFHLIQEGHIRHKNLQYLGEGS